MNILLIGSGGREHAIAWKLAQSPKLNELFIAPGNAGTHAVGINVSLDTGDFKAVVAFIEANKVAMVVVGPEAPLVDGIHDYIKEHAPEVGVIGPQKHAAQLEGSKDFAKQFMFRHNIPTAGYQSFTKDTVAEGQAYLETLKAPYVLKADGLAAGKGVLILEDLQEAKRELAEMLSNEKFGAASTTVVIEEFLDGIEMSSFVLTDGENYVVLPNAKDYKRIGEGDKGLNTGGMGAISPVSFASDAFLKKVEEKVIKPTVEGLKKDGIPYVGFIFIGLIKVGDEPFVIEYNCRMGDPETEVVMPRIQNDLVDLFAATANGTLDAQTIQLDPRFATTVMLVSGGYPEAYEKGKEIHGLDMDTDSIVFHAGTKSADGTIVTNGGRVLAITSYGETMKEALSTSYNTVEKISFEKKNYRKDIGFDL